MLQKRESVSDEGEAIGLFGGSIEHGETELQAVLREAKEELGWDLDEKDIVYLGYRDATMMGDPDVVSKSYLYTIKLNQNLLDSIVMGEGDGYELLSIEEARTRQIFHFDHIVFDMLEHWMARIN